MKNTEKSKEQLLKEIEKLREGEEMYKAMYEKAPLSYQSLDKNGNFIDVNPMWLKTLGYSREEVIGKWFGDFLRADYVDHFKKNFQEFKKRGYVNDVKFYMKKKNGEDICVSYEGCIGYTPDGKFKQTYCVFKDITKEHEAEKRLIASETLLKVTQEITKAGGWEYDVVNDKMCWTDQTYFIHDMELNEILPGSVDHIKQGLLCYDEKDRPIIYQAFQNCVKKGISYDLEFPFTTNKGQRIWIHTSAKAIKEKAEIVKVIGNIMDITESKKLEAELLLKNKVFESSITANSIADIQGIITYVNNSFIRIWSYEKKEEVIGKPIHEFLKFGDKAKNIITVLNETDIWEGEFTAVKKDGTTFSAYGLSTTITNKYGELIGYQSAVLDISERKKAEEELLRSKKITERYLNVAAEIIISLDTEGNITMLNDSGHRLLGYKARDLIGKNWFTTCLPDEIIEKVRGVFLKLTKGDIELVANYENTVVTKNGEKKIIFWHNSLLKDDKDNIIGLLSSGENITERKKANEKINHLNLVLYTIRNVNQLIIKEKNRDVLIQKTCKILTEGRGYFNAWIVLFNKQGEYINSAESGLGKNFIPIRKMLKEGKLPNCGIKTLRKKGLVIIKDPNKECLDCPLSANYSGQSSYSICIRHNDNIYGLLSVSAFKYYINDKEEQGLFKEVAGDIAFALYSVEMEEERKQAEETLRNRERVYRTLINNLPGFAYRCRDDKSWTINYISTGCEDITGYTPDDFINNKNIEFNNIIHPDYRDKLWDIWQNVLKEKISFEYEYPIITKSKEIKWVWEKGCGIYSDEGELLFLEGFITDITERKKADEKINHLNLVLYTIRNVNQLIIKEKNRDVLIQKACKILTENRGYFNAWIVLFNKQGEYINSAESGLGKSFLPIKKMLKKGKLPNCGIKTLRKKGLSIIKDPNKECLDCPLSANYSGQSSYSICIRHNDNIYGLLSVSASKYYINDKEEQSLFKEVAGDIAFALYSIEMAEERKQVEDVVRNERDNMMNIFKTMEDGIYIVNQQYDIQYVNPVLVKDFGVYEGRKCYDYLHDRTEVCPWCKALDIFEGKKTVHWEWTSPKNGKTYDLIDTPLKNPDGSISKLEIFRDITELKKVESALREKEELNRSITESAADAIISINSDGIILSWNNAAEKIFGYSSSEMINKDFSEIIPAQYKDVHNFGIKRLKNGGKGKLIGSIVELTTLRKDGTEFPVELSLSSWEINNQKYFTGIIRDISERKQAEEDMKKKMNELEIFNDASVDREIMINELRKEINEMLKKIGKKEKYDIIT